MVLFLGKLSLKIKFYRNHFMLIIYVLFGFTGFLEEIPRNDYSSFYTVVNPNNSTSIRFAVWDCSLQKIKSSNHLIRNGVGDVLYFAGNLGYVHPDLDKYYNTHNQYFSILGTGLIILFSFMIFFFYLFSCALKIK
jgi:hypothetical protein